MTDKERFEQYRRQLCDPDDETFGGIQLLPIGTLHAAAMGDIDLNIVARAVLAGSGLDKDLQWVGFAKAAEYWGNLPNAVTVANARRAAQATSPARARAARENGRKGGRPKTTTQE